MRGNQRMSSFQGTNTGEETHVSGVPLVYLPWLQGASRERLLLLLNA
jgi:hypothetical protein